MDDFCRNKNFYKYRAAIFSQRSRPNEHCQYGEFYGDFLIEQEIHNGRK